MKDFACLGVAAVASLVPPPPIVTATIEPPASFTSSLTRFVPGIALCEGGPVTAPLMEEPLPVGTQRPIISGAASAERPSDIVVAFRIDAQGRPLGITTTGPTPPTYLLDTRDVVPAFAAWRFAPGTERTNCEVRFAARSEPLLTADPKTLYRYLAEQKPGFPGFNATVGRAAFDRLWPERSDCKSDTNVRRRAFPAFEEIAQAPGTRSHSFLSFDVDRKGQPRNIKLLGSGGNAELDRQSVAAVVDSRFAPAERTGCLYYYYRSSSEPMAAPEPPTTASLRAADSNCPVDEQGPRSKLPNPVFPEEFRQRSIEGWAVIRFDVAPWGDVGNVSVAAAEPAAAFGERARSFVQGAKRSPSDQGYRGCINRVRFTLPPS